MDGEKQHKLLPAALTLAAIEGPSSGTVYQNRGTELTLGRTKSSKIWVKDPSVSEHHARIYWAEGAWWIQDVGSSNGTGVNGVAVEESGAAVRLKDGDVILVGENSQLEVKLISTFQDDVSVEQYITAEATRMADRLEAKLEQAASKAREHWKKKRKELLQSII